MLYFSLTNGYSSRRVRAGECRASHPLPPADPAGVFAF